VGRSNPDPPTGPTLSRRASQDSSQPPLRRSSLCHAFPDPELMPDGDTLPWVHAQDGNPTRSHPFDRRSCPVGIHLTNPSADPAPR